MASGGLAGLVHIPVDAATLEGMLIIPLVAQCVVEGIPLISSDATLDRYPIERLW